MDSVVITIVLVYALVLGLVVVLTREGGKGSR